MKYVSNTKSGFTLIETMISISLFLIIITMGMNSLLNASLVHQKSQDMASIIDNITFMTEDMSRNIRTGYNYHCGDPLSVQTPTVETPKSCTLGGNIFFENGTTSGVPGNYTDQWGYKIDSLGGGIYNVSRTTDGGLTWVQLNPPGVVFKSFSGFSVLGAESELQNGDIQQPLVVIKLAGTITYKNTISPFNIQTTVSQRLLDR
jgi:prepilin-type N-terminal cleavage/methylation domain-containing protein